MSKVVMSLPKGMGRNSVIGGGAALVVYTLLQMVCALLIHREVVGVELLYPMVCFTAAAAAFVGCLLCMLWGKDRSVLTVSAVVAVFLTLTLAAAFLTADAVAMQGGLAGVGLGMAAGGLCAVIVVPSGEKRGRRDGKKRRSKRRRT